MKYNLVIIGAGPAGLMAASRALELGAKVIILEKNKRPGIKLLVTGGGRGNITNNINDPKTLAAGYTPNGRFLISAFSRFGASEFINFIEREGVKTKEENNGRIFPISNKATDVLNALIGYIKKYQGEIKTEAKVNAIINADNKISKIILESGEEIIADNYLIATGGKSYPATGSTGDAYHWLKELGHNIILPRPALAPLFVKEKFIKDLEGLSLENISLNLFYDHKKIKTINGAIIFTRNGLSGPAALDVSRYIDLNSGHKYQIELDFFPEKSDKEFEEYLQKSFHSGHKLFKNVLEKIVPPKLAPVIISLLKIKAEKQSNSVTKEERKILVKILKHFPLSINGLGNFEQAMVTAGGIDLKEVDPKTMHSKLIKNLFLAGEILDLTGPTGGYNLQLCWSTGYIAGEAAVDKNILM